ncbi:MAG: porin family protein [Elusimicrobiota bacterium]|nr:MAG: porin family protein [Elusimicrobiota bacterium]
MKKILMAALLLAPALALPAGAVTDDGVTVGSRSGVSFGGRGSYFKPKNAADGNWSGGAQLRLHMGPIWALEGSGDIRQDRFGGTTVDVIPVQASLLAYLLPGKVVSPYLLAGAGWYYTHVRDANDSTYHRFGPHAGGGLQAFLNKHWSIDGSARHIWLSSYRSQDAANPLGRDIDASGWMATAALNYHF